MPTELEELRQIHAELSELAKGGIALSAVIEKWPLLYKRKPESERLGYQIPGVIAGATGLLSDSAQVAGEFEPDGRPWLDANGNPVVNSDGEPFRIIPGWKASIILTDETLNVSASAQQIRRKITESLTILGRFLPADAPPRRLSSGSVGPWLLHLAERCASGAAGKRHQTQWMLFGWARNGSLVQADNITSGWPFPDMLKLIGDPAPQRVEVADVIGASQVVLSEWIKEIEMQGKDQPSIVGSTAGTTTRRFAVAFTFPGGKRAYVEAVDRALREFLRPEQIFYDNRYKHELAKPNLDTHLQKIYHDQAELIVVFLCREYQEKEWCGIELRAVRDIIKKGQGDNVMPFRFDDADVLGLFSIDGYIDAAKNTPEQAAELIYQRLLHNRGQVPGATVAARETPPAKIDPAAVLQAANDVLAFLRQERQTERKSIPLTPPSPTPLDRIMHYPFPGGDRRRIKGEEQAEISVQIPLQFTTDFWEKCALIARAAKEWDIPAHDCMFRLLRLRPASDQDTSLEDEPRLLDQVGELSDVVADRAFARSKV